MKTMLVSLKGIRVPSQTRQECSKLRIIAPLTRSDEEQDNLALNSGFFNLFTIGGGPSVSGYGSLGFAFGLDK